MEISKQKQCNAKATLHHSRNICRTPETPCWVVWKERGNEEDNRAKQSTANKRENMLMGGERDKMTFCSLDQYTVSHVLDGLNTNAFQLA